MYVKILWRCRTMFVKLSPRVTITLQRVLVRCYNSNMICLSHSTVTLYTIRSMNIIPLHMVYDQTPSDPQRACPVAGISPFSHQYSNADWKVVIDGRVYLALGISGWPQSTTTNIKDCEYRILRMQGRVGSIPYWDVLGASGVCDTYIQELISSHLIPYPSPLPPHPGWSHILTSDTGFEFIQHLTRLILPLGKPSS